MAKGSKEKELMRRLRAAWEERIEIAAELPGAVREVMKRLLEVAEKSGSLGQLVVAFGVLYDKMAAAWGDVGKREEVVIRSERLRAVGAPERVKMLREVAETGVDVIGKLSEPVGALRGLVEGRGVVAEEERGEVEVAAEECGGKESGSLKRGGLEDL